jgi:hypothetical protein
LDVDRDNHDTRPLLVVDTDADGVAEMQRLLSSALQIDRPFEKKRYSGP